MDLDPQWKILQSHRGFEKGTLLRNRSRSRRTWSIAMVERSPRRQVVGSNPAGPIT